MKKEKLFLWVLCIFSLFFIAILSFVVHELVHYWQDNFESEEICFVGVSNLKDPFGKDVGWGWCVWSDSNRTEKRFIFENIFNMKDSTDLDAIVIQFIFFFLSCVIVTLMYIKISKKIDNDEE